MKSLKNIFICVLCVCLVVGCCFSVGAATNTVITISTKTASPGEEVKIDISISNNPGIMAMAFCITYDSNALTYESCEKGYLSSYTLKDHSDEGHISFVNVEGSDKTTNGKIISLTFKVKPDAKPGKYAIKLANSDRKTYGYNLHNCFSNSNLDYIVPVVSSGSITIPETCENSGHKFDAGTVITPADCTHTGSKTHNCVRCGFSETVEIPITHDFEDEWTIDKAATLEEDGVMSRHCKKCDEVTDEIAFSYEEIGGDDIGDNSSEETPDTPESSNTASDNSGVSDSEITDNSSVTDNSDTAQSDKTTNTQKPSVNNVVGEKVPQQEAEKLENFPKPEQQKPEQNNSQVPDNTSSENPSNQQNSSVPNANDSDTLVNNTNDSEPSFYATTTGIIMIVVCSLLSIAIITLGIILIIKNKKS